MISERAELSEMERKVLKHLVDGLTIKDAAVRLGIAFSTADTYVRRIYNKIGVRSRAAAVVWYCQNPF